MAEWSVQRVVRGDGTSDDTKFVFQNGVSYASDKCRGGNSTFWAIEDGSVLMCDRQKYADKVKPGFGVSNLPEVSCQSSSTKKGIESSLTGSSRFSSSVASKTRVGTWKREESIPPVNTKKVAEIAGLLMKQWLREHSGVVRDIGGPNARKQVVQLRRWYLRDYGEVFWDQEDLMCVYTEQVHALDALRGRTVQFAYRIVLQSELPTVGSLSGIFALLRHLKSIVPPHQYARVEMKVRKEDEWKYIDRAPFNWLSTQRRCFVVQFEQPGKSDHDAFVKERGRVVWDNERRSPVELNPDYHRLSTGVNECHG